MTGVGFLVRTKRLGRNGLFNVDRLHDISVCANPAGFNVHENVADSFSRNGYSRTPFEGDDKWKHPAHCADRGARPIHNRGASMKRISAIVLIVACARVAAAQEIAPVPTPVPTPVATPYAPLAKPAESPLGVYSGTPTNFSAAETSTFLTGDHQFDNFIGFMSNPILNVDPRSITAIWPVFASVGFETLPALPNGDQQVYGAGINVALNDRLSIGMTQGGYTTIHLDRQSGPFRDRFGRLRDKRDFQGDRDGWLNLGGFVQYTLIADAEGQFLLTAGSHWTAPSGSHEVFQGLGPARLAPYATIGKAWGQVHLLATSGYDFGLGSGGAGLNIFYANVHIDRQFGWLYPLVEFNCTYHQSNIGQDAPLRGAGLLDFGNFSGSGNIVTMAVGANAVLVPAKLELGAVYITSIATQRDFDLDGLMVKLLYRY
jgi:hypothetical protein